MQDSSSLHRWWRNGLKILRLSSTTVTRQRALTNCGRHGWSMKKEKLSLHFSQVAASVDISRRVFFTKLLVTPTERNQAAFASLRRNNISSGFLIHPREWSGMKAWVILVPRSTFYLRYNGGESAYCKRRFLFATITISRAALPSITFLASYF